MKKTIIIISVVLAVVVLAGLTGLYFVMESNAKKDVLLIENDIAELEEDIERLEDEKISAQADAQAHQDEKSAIELKNIGLQEEIDMMALEIEEKKAALPKEDLGVTPEMINAHIAILALEKYDMHDADCFGEIPEKIFSQDGEVITYYPAGNAESEDYVKISYLLDRYSGNISRIEVSHANRDDLYGKYKLMVSQSYILYMESVYRFDEEVISQADDMIENGEHFDGTVLAYEPEGEAGKVFVIKVKEDE